jgi:hypothetical protein
MPESQDRPHRPIDLVAGEVPPTKSPTKGSTKGAPEADGQPTPDLVYFGGKVGKPLHILNKLTRSKRARSAAAADQAFERARLRYLIARTAATFAPDGSASAQRAAVQHAVDAGLITLEADTTLPTLDTIRALVARWKGGSRSITDYLDRPRRGRTKLTLDERLTTVIKTAAACGHPNTVAGVLRLCVKTAEQAGLTPPSYATVMDRYTAEGHEVRVAAKHGEKAVEMDGVPHSTIPVHGPHDVWTIDECTLPVWARAYNPVKKQWRSIRPDLIVIQDYYSRAVIAYWIVDPADRRHRSATKAGRASAGAPDEGASREPEHADDGPASKTAATKLKRAISRWAAATATDLKGALFSAACRELATPATVAFAGSLPRRIRWDNARSHKALIEALEGLGIEVADLPFERPANRGIVERGQGTLKGWCDVLFSHRDRVIPTDRLPAAKRGTSTLAKEASRKTRRPLVRVLETELLPTVPALRVAFDAEVVRHYNHAHEHRGIEEVTPHTKYVQGLADMALPGEAQARTRSGRDILGLVPWQVTEVQRGGVVHREGRSEHRFSYEVAGALLRLKTRVMYRADPLLRALFATAADRDAVLVPLAQWAADQNPTEVAEDQAATATLYADHADGARLTQDIIDLAKAALARGRDDATQQMRDAALKDAPEPPPAAGAESPDPAMTGEFDDGLVA